MRSSAMCLDITLLQRNVFPSLVFNTFHCLLLGTEFQSVFEEHELTRADSLTGYYGC